MMSVHQVENMILRSFQNEPFHSLYFYFNIRPIDGSSNGGTCSDKVLSVKEMLMSQGIKCYLHSSIINNLETHRLLRILINNKVYFADVGNAWPSIFLFPADREIKYTVFGITFYSKITSRYLEIHQIRNGENKLSVSIPFESKSEADIMKDINTRYNSDKKYPFSGKIRFAQIIGDSFYFLRDTTLHIYSSKEYTKKEISLETNEDLKKNLKHYFDFDISDKVGVIC